MFHQLVILLLILASSRASRPIEDEGVPLKVGEVVIDRAAFQETLAACSAKLSLSVGSTFWECLKEESPEFAAAAAKSYGGRYTENMDDSFSMKDTLRAHTCTTDDGGTPPLRSFEFNYTAPPCPTDAEAAAGGGFSYKSGFLPGGNDMAGPPSGDTMSVGEAKLWCAQQGACRGFTYESSQEPSAQLKAHMYFKTVGNAAGQGEGWHTYLLKGTAACVADPEPRSYHVDVLKESPLTVLVRQFATEAECEHMYELCSAQLRQSTVGAGSGGTTTDDSRTSRSANMFPDLSDEGAALTTFTRRLFAAARHFTGLDLQPEGQEPLNAVVYGPGQQYKPHCDGDCSDRPYEHGKRTATTLLYCAVADSGGGTSFTKGGLKVAPRARDLLFFDHRQRTEPPGTGDMSPVTEHSGCPVKVICRSLACCSHTRISRVLLTPPPTCPRVYAFLTRTRALPRITRWAGSGWRRSGFAMACPPRLRGTPSRIGGAAGWWTDIDKALSMHVLSYRRYSCKL
jgi:prolyl 4-hydroxylase